MFLIQNDFGIAIDLQVINQDCVAVDLTSATTVQMEFVLPDGTVSLKTAAVIGLPTEGRIRYVVEEDFLVQIGTWSVRGRVSEGTSKVYRTEKLKFAVLA